MQGSTEYRRILSVSTLSGDSVVNPDGEDLGEIEEIMLDVETGQVSYAVLSLGGFLGMGEKLFAIPWQALAVDEANERMVLDVSKDRLENAPGFDKDDWPEFADRSWGQRIHEHYGYDPYWEGTAG